MGGADAPIFLLPLEVTDHDGEVIFGHCDCLVELVMIKQVLDRGGPCVAVKRWQGASVKNIYKYIDLGSSIDR